MSYRTQLYYDDESSSTTTPVGPLTASNVVVLDKIMDSLYVNLGTAEKPNLVLVNRVVSAISKNDAPASLTVKVANGSTWLVYAVLGRVAGEKTAAGLSWEYPDTELHIVAQYPAEPGATTLDDDEGVYWSVESPKVPPVKLKVQVKRLTT